MGNSTYDSGKINETTANGRKNKIRLLIGDTLSRDFLLDNNEIAAFLAIHSDSVQRAAIDCARAIAAQFSRKADIAIGKSRVAASKRADSYWKLAYELEMQDLPTIKGGGFSEQDRDVIEQDQDVIQPHFKTGDMDFPGAASGENVNNSRLNDDDC